MSNESSDLDSLRERIDQVTLEMARLIIERSKIVGQIGSVKQRLGMPVDDQAREARLRAKVAESCQNADDVTLASRLLNFLLTESVRAQSEHAGIGQSHMSVFAEAQKLEAEGRQIIHMEVGEPDSAPVSAVADALASACSEGYTKYGSALGLDELRDAIARRESARGCSVERENVIVTTGARFAVYLTIGSLLDAGDEIVVIEPAWPAYADCAMRSGIKVHRIHTTLESGWEPGVSEIESVITPNTKMLVLNYPNNPTGKVLPEKLLAEIMDVAAHHSLYVLSDEIYSAYSDSGFKSALEFGYDRTIVTQSLSKSHAMTGFRIGYAIAAPPIVSKLAKLQSLCIVSPPSPIQYAALAALGANPPDTPGIMPKRLDAMISNAGRLEFQKPDGAMYLFARLPRGLDCHSIVSECLRQGLAVAPGSGFGNYPDFVRLSACQDIPTLVRGMNIINSVTAPS